MEPVHSRRSFLGVSGSLLAAILSGCFFQGVQQPFGDLVISNNDDQNHEVVVIAVNQHVQARQNENAATTRFEQVVEEQSTISREGFFEAGDTEVTVTVDGETIEETRVEIWRGEGGDDDRHEETLRVTINPDGDVQISVDVTHTPR